MISGCAVSKSAGGGNISRLYRFNLILLPGYDQTVFASVNSNDIGAELFNIQQQPRHVAIVLRLANEYEMQQLRNARLGTGIVVESVTPQHQ